MLQTDAVYVKQPSYVTETIFGQNPRLQLVDKQTSEPVFQHERSTLCDDVFNQLFKDVLKGWMLFSSHCLLCDVYAKERSAD